MELSLLLANYQASNGYSARRLVLMFTNSEMLDGYKQLTAFYLMMYYKS